MDGFNNETSISNRTVVGKTEKDAHKILFLLPPNIEFSDFVSPPSNISTIQKGERQFGSVITDIPLGVISLSAYLKQFVKLESSCIDFNVELNKDTEFDYEDFAPYFADKMKHLLPEGYSPDFIAISSLFTPAYQSIIDLADISRELFPEAAILVGGNLPTSMYREILNDSTAVDAVCYGEGELPFLKLIQATDKAAYLLDSNSWVTHEKLQNPNASYSHDFIWELDEIPFLDYDMLDLEGYKLNPTSSRYSVADKYELDTDTEGELEDTIGRDVSGEAKELISMPIMTSRGCPFKCTFCASHAAHGRSMRYHSHERVQEDLERMVSSYDLTGVVIQDDHFMAGKRRPYEIVEGIGDLQLDMFFQNALAIYALDREFLELLKRAGVDELVLPVESGSMRVLRDEMRKPLKLDRIPEVTKDCRDIGIYTDCNIIIGMPGETKQDIAESREFLKSIYADWFRVFVATPIPGSEMHEKVLHNNYYKVPPIKANYKRAVIETEHMTPEYVQFMTYYMNIELNFVHNANMRLERYSTALEGFKNVINVKPDHAVAHYCAAKALAGLGKADEAANHMQAAKDFVAETTFWDVFINDFNLELSIPKSRLMAAREMEAAL